MNAKICTKCKIEKDFSDFYKDKKGKNGLQAQCKECAELQKTEYRQTHKKERSEYENNQNLVNPEWREGKAKRSATYYKKLKEDDSQVLKDMRTRSKLFLRHLRKDHPSYFLLKAAKSRAKIYNLPFDITVEDIVIPKYCPILEIELFSGIGKTCNNSPSVDKIIPELGYVSGNVRVISHLANVMKNSATPVLLQNFAKNIINYINSKDIVQTIENGKSIEVWDKEPTR